MPSKTLFVVAAAALAAAVSSGAAQASAPQVLWQSGNVGPVAFAEASWETATATAVTHADVLAANTRRDAPGSGSAGGAASHVFFELHTTYLDANGAPTGGVDVSGSANGAVPFTIDSRTLSSASVAATVPVTRCALDADGNETSCVDGRTAVDVAWTGSGQLTHPNEQDHFVGPGSFVFIDRLNGTFRPATATATLDGVSFGADSLQFADLGNNTQLTVLVCPHGSDADGNCL